MSEDSLQELIAFFQETVLVLGIKRWLSGLVTSASTLSPIYITVNLHRNYITIYITSPAPRGILKMYSLPFFLFHVLKIDSLQGGGERESSLPLL